MAKIMSEQGYLSAIDAQDKEIERLKKALEDVKVQAEREGCTHAGCDAHAECADEWHSARCPMRYVEIAQQALKEGG